MPSPRIVLLTLLILLAFAANSLLCRLALDRTAIDAASFTSLRLASGALVLWLCARRRASNSTAKAGSWGAALMLFVYAAGFSFAYLSLTAATGALLLFGAVQVTMVGQGLRCGERLTGRQWFGLVLASGGLVGLLLPGLTAPDPLGAGLMLAAGIGWGIYSLLGRVSGDPVRVTAGNFLRATPFALLLSLATAAGMRLDPAGIAYALASGALASGLGYVGWYRVLPHLRATTAATIQLSVPVLAAIGGLLLLGEPLTVRLVLASIAILGGVGLVIRARPSQMSDRLDKATGGRVRTRPPV